MRKRTNWAEVKKDYLESGDSLAAVALRFGLSKRAVEKIAADEGWAALRSAHRSSMATVAREAVEEIQRKQREDLVKDIEVGITKLSYAIRETEPRSMEGCAAAMAKLIELHNKMVPVTAEELAEMAVNAGIKPNEFLKALNSAWELRQQA